MSRFKKMLAAGCALAVAGCLGAGLAGCGSTEGIAATWAHGELEEQQVTNYIENMRSMYGYSSDVSGWETFLKERTYDTDETSDLSALTGESAEESADSAAESSESAAESSESSAESSESSAESSEGTVQDYREFVIRELLRNDIAEWEASQHNLEVSDEELDAAFQTAKDQLEASYMKGTFESLIQMQGYESVDEFKEELKSNLQVQKLQEEIVGANSESEDFDEDKWDKYVDGLMDYAEIKINDMPSNSSYDPAVLAQSASSAESDADADAGAETVEVDADAEAESGESSES